jgi:hypothetical protein
VVSLQKADKHGQLLSEKALLLQRPSAQISLTYLLVIRRMTICNKSNHKELLIRIR